MASIGNVLHQINRAVPIESLTSTDFKPLFESSQGVAVAIAYVTGIAELSAARGSTIMAPGGLVVSIFSAGTISSHLYMNVAAANSCTWEELNL